MPHLGLSAHYHDAAAAVVGDDGTVLAAAQEERFSRRKNDPAFPVRALAACLDQAGLRPADLGSVSFHEKPLLKLERVLHTHLALAPRSLRSFTRSLSTLGRSRLMVHAAVEDALPGFAGPVYFIGHHLSHAAAAFFPSPFADAAVLTVDGVGEWATASLGRGEGVRVALRRELRFPDSLGLLYSAVTAYLGFEVNEGEYKVMGLAAYGEPRFEAALRDRLVDLKEDGSLGLNAEYLDFGSDAALANGRLHELLGGPPRRPGEPLAQRHKDAARSLQAVTEEAVLRMARAAMKEAGSRRLCMAGGVALNCVANARVLRESGAEALWVQPAAGDAGSALGAALYAAHALHGAPRAGGRDRMRGARLGPAYGDAAVEGALAGRGAQYVRLPREELLVRAAALLADGKAIGWFQGAMEFGPRALGGRSILADPRPVASRERLNAAVKGREDFRPFALAVRAARAGDVVDLAAPSPYMLLTARVKAAGLDAVTHVDGSTRVQTVSAEEEPLFHDLLAAFERRTGCPALLNTSFNRAGEPIVESPAQAYDCFRRAGLDALFAGPFLVTGGRMPPPQAPPPPPAW
ncbi:MAG: hypothetical protein KGL53_05445, partial [Elusimicrobia bacterium]|nr:hypothetical protein [Elusimicrobiota bacterium]